MAVLRSIFTLLALSLAVACRATLDNLPEPSSQPTTTTQGPTLTSQPDASRTLPPSATATRHATYTRTPRKTASPTLEQSITPTPSPTLTSTPTLTQTLTLTATATITPNPTATSAPTRRRLTTGGCCVRPFWSPDGRQVWYLDRPTAEAVTAIWGVDVASGEPTVITDQLGVFSPDARLVAYPSSDRLTYIQRTDGEERWVVPSGGRSIIFSPDGQRIGWQVVSSQNGSYYKRNVELWLANVDGTDARKVITVTGGGIVGWFPNANLWLVLSSDLSEKNYSLTVLDIDSANGVEIARAPRLGGASISPKGEWVVFQVTASGDKQRDGLWVVRSDGRGMRKLDVYGSYQWRSEGRLAIVPLELSAQSHNQSHRLLEVEAGTGVVSQLTDPTNLSFRIANGDWAMAPGGNKLVYVSAEDRNLWLIQLP